MYCEFLYIILDYFSILDKREKRFELYIPFAIGIGSLIYTIFIDNNTQYVFINNTISFIGTLLGFTLAALVLLLSSERIEQSTKKISTEKKVRGKSVSLYRIIVIYYSYLITCETLLCALYYIASLFPNLTTGVYNDIMNTLFIMAFFHLLFETIRAVTNIYFMTIKE